MVAADLAPEYPDGVWLVELAAVAPPAAGSGPLVAKVAEASGRRVHAIDLYRQSLAICQGAGDHWGSAACLQGLAELSATDDRIEHAAILGGIADVLRRAIGAPLTPTDRAAHDAAMSAAQ